MRKIVIKIESNQTKKRADINFDRECSESVVEVVAVRHDSFIVFGNETMSSPENKKIKKWIVVVFVDDTKGIN